MEISNEKAILEQVDKYLSAISVAGDNVMYMAQARTLLKQLYSGLKEENG